MKGQTNRTIIRSKLQRKLRHSMTDAERLFWKALRGRQMAAHKFRRQHPFDDYILDFVCLETKLVIEVDGGQHGEQREADDRRTDNLAKAGFRIIRFWNNELLREFEAVKERIWLELQKTTEPHPHPAPPLEGEGAKEVPCH